MRQRLKYRIVGRHVVVEVCSPSFLTVNNNVDRLQRWFLRVVLYQTLITSTVVSGNFHDSDVIAIDHYVTVDPFVLSRKD